MKIKSVRTGLLLAFGSISALVIAASGTGLTVLNSLNTQQEQVVARAVPSVLIAKGIVGDAGELNRIRESLSFANDPARIAEARNTLSQVEANAMKNLAELRRLNGERPDIVALSDTFSIMAKSLEDYATASKRRIELEQARGVAFREAGSVAQTITEQSDTLVSNARSRISNALSTLYDFVGDPTQTKRVFSTLDSVVDVDLFKSEQMNNLKIDSLRVVRLLSDITAASSDEDVAKTKKNIDSVYTDLSRDIKTIPDPNRKTQVEERFAALRKATEAEPGGLLALTHSVVTTRAELTALGESIGKAEIQLNDVVARTAAEQNQIIQSAQTRMADTAALARLVMIGLSVGAIVIAILIGYFYVQRSILRRLTILSETTGRLSEGDIAVDIPPASEDELGSMAAALRVFKANAEEKMRLESDRLERDAKAVRERAAEMERIAGAFEASVLGIVNAVSTQASDMQQIARSMKETVDGTGERTKTVATASELASENVQMVAASAEQLTASIREITKQVLVSADASDSAVREAQQVQEEVSKLNVASARIGEVIGIINGLAAQTNLLALNATIEAARAGEAGKGFAVVASEVKTLAKQSASATDEIAEQIGRIQQQVEQSVSSIARIVKTIENLNSISTGISAAVNQQQAATNEISRSVQMAAQGSMEVNNVIREVAEDVEETGNASGSVLEVSDRLAKQSEDMRHEVATFLDTIRRA